MNLFRLELRKKWKPTHDYMVKLQLTTFSCQWICEWTYICCTPVVAQCISISHRMAKECVHLMSSHRLIMIATDRMSILWGPVSVLVQHCSSHCSMKLVEGPWTLYLDLWVSCGLGIGKLVRQLLKRFSEAALFRHQPHLLSMPPASWHWPQGSRLHFQCMEFLSSLRQHKPQHLSSLSWSPIPICRKDETRLLLVLKIQLLILVFQTSRAGSHKCMLRMTWKVGICRCQTSTVHIERLKWKMMQVMGLWFQHNMHLEGWSLKLVLRGRCKQQLLMLNNWSLIWHWRWRAIQQEEHYKFAGSILPVLPSRGNCWALVSPLALKALSPVWTVQHIIPCVETGPLFTQTHWSVSPTISSYLFFHSCFQRFFELETTCWSGSTSNDTSSYITLKLTWFITWKVDLVRTFMLGICAKNL